MKVASLTDLYSYYPYHVKKDKNKSDELYYVMTSGKNAQHTGKYLEHQKTDLQLHTTLEFLWAKIEERFPKVGAAFRYFDTNKSNDISLNEFIYGCERLRIKLHVKEHLAVFNYLDQDADGNISYKEFCNLCEERRR